MFVFFYDEWWSRHGINFNSYLEAGYSVATLSSWIFQGTTAILWPLSYVHIWFAWAFYAMCLIQVYLSISASWIVPLMWNYALFIDDVPLLRNFLWQSIVEMVLIMGQVFVNLFFIRDLKQWYYDFARPYHFKILCE